VAEKEEDYGYAEFTRTIDTIIIGHKTYEKVASMGIDYSDTEKNMYVINRTEKSSERTTQFYSGFLTELIST